MENLTDPLIDTDCLIDFQECAAPPHPPVDDPDWQLSNNGSLTLPSSTLTPDGLKATQGYTNAAERTGDAKALRSMK